MSALSNLGLATMLDPGDLGLMIMPNSWLLGSVTMPDLRRVGLINYVRPKQINMTIMHFSCQERERKKKHKQSIISGNPAIICPHTSHHVEEGTTSIELDSRWQELTIGKRPKPLLNGTGATHSLKCVEHEPTTFWLKNKKYNVKIPKRPSWSS